MKRLFLCLIICGLYFSAEARTDTIPIPHRGQDKYKHEFTATIGTLTLPEILVTVGEGMGTIFSLGNYNTANIQQTGAYNFAYHYYFTKIWSLSADYSYERITNDLVDGNDNYQGNSESIFNSYMVGAYAHYLRYNYIQLYSGLAGGIFTYETDSHYDNTDYHDRSIAPAFQITALGFRLGGKLAFTGELISFGNKGALHAGLSYRF